MSFELNNVHGNQNDRKAGQNDENQEQPWGLNPNGGWSQKRGNKEQHCTSDHRIWIDESRLFSPTAFGAKSRHVSDAA